MKRYQRLFEKEKDMWEADSESSTPLWAVGLAGNDVKFFTNKEQAEIYAKTGINNKEAKANQGSVWKTKEGYYGARDVNGNVYYLPDKETAIKFSKYEDPKHGFPMHTSVYKSEILGKYKNNNRWRGEFKGASAVFDERSSSLENMQDAISFSKGKHLTSKEGKKPGETWKTEDGRWAGRKERFEGATTAIFKNKENLEEWMKLPNTSSSIEEEDELAKKEVIELTNWEIHHYEEPLHNFFAVNNTGTRKYFDDYKSAEAYRVKKVKIDPIIFRATLIRKDDPDHGKIVYIKAKAKFNAGNVLEDMLKDKDFKDYKLEKGSFKVLGKFSQLDDSEQDLFDKQYPDVAAFEDDRVEHLD